MSNDALLRSEGLKVLSEKLGPVGMERFVVLLNRDLGNPACLSLLCGHSA